VEVVGDPYGSLAPGAIEDSLRPIWRWLLPYYLRQICHGATTAAYVTQYALQKFYPPQSDKFSTSYSDVMTTYYSSIDLGSSVVTEKPRTYSEGQTAFTLICVGAMEVMPKAQDILIKACALCVKRRLDLRLVLVGDDGDAVDQQLCLAQQGHDTQRNGGGRGGGLDDLADRGSSQVGDRRRRQGESHALHDAPRPHPRL